MNKLHAHWVKEKQEENRGDESMGCQISIFFCRVEGGSDGGREIKG